MRWRAGTAPLLPEDDARVRHRLLGRGRPLYRPDGIIVRQLAADGDTLTIRIDLDERIPGSALLINDDLSGLADVGRGLPTHAGGPRAYRPRPGLHHRAAAKCTSQWPIRIMWDGLRMPTVRWHSTTLAVPHPAVRRGMAGGGGPVNGGGPGERVRARAAASGVPSPWLQGVTTYPAT